MQTQCKYCCYPKYFELLKIPEEVGIYLKESIFFSGSTMSSCEKTVVSGLAAQIAFVQVST